jgi:hypothetical protein
LTTFGVTRCPLTESDASPFSAGVLEYKLLTSRFGTRTLIVNDLRAAGFTVIATRPSNG